MSRINLIPVIMENQLPFNFILSLEEIAKRKVAINLWSEHDILTSIEKFSTLSIHRDYLKNWSKTVESKVEDKTSKLGLSASLTKQVLLYVKPIGLQIKKWKDFHECYLMIPGWELRAKFDAPILSKLCWNTAGILDYLKTAEEIIRCEMVDIVKRYTLACLYCLDNYIPVLWQGLPEEIKRVFYNEEDILPNEMTNLEFCWPYILKGEQSKLGDTIGNGWSFNQRAFAYSARCGNKAATKYFFQKLTEEEKDSSFISGTVKSALTLFTVIGNLQSDYFPSDKTCGVLSYLLSLMNHEQQVEILKEQYYNVLYISLAWPYQDICLNIVELIWDYLPPDHDSTVLYELSNYFKASIYYFPKFFQKFFTHSSISFRKKFVDRECRFGDFLPGFFDIQDSETIKVIFRNIDASDRVRLVSSERSFRLLYNCIFKEGWHMMEVCIREATLSKKEGKILKDAFERYLRRTHRGRIAARSPQWIRFCQLLDEISARARNKRCLEDETLKTARKALLR